MRPKFKHQQALWDRYATQYPHHAHIATSVRPEKVSALNYGEHASVPSEKKGWRLWAFESEEGRDRLVSENAGFARVPA